MIKKSKFYVIGLIAVIAILGIVWTRFKIDARKNFYQKNLEECRLIKEQLDIDLLLLKRQSQHLIKYKGHFDNCNIIKNRQLKWSKLLKQLAHNIPQDIWLEKLNIVQKRNNAQFMKVGNRGQHNFSNLCYDIQLDGKATHPKYIKKFITNIDSSIYFNNKSLKIFNRQDLIWQFQIKSNIKR